MSFSRSSTSEEVSSLLSLGRGDLWRFLLEEDELELSVPSALLGGNSISSGIEMREAVRNVLT